MKPSKSLKFQRDLCDLLRQNGWIERIERDRQDLFIDWSPLGLERGKRFIDEVRALRPDDEWIDDELAELRAFGIYVGFIQPTRRDQTIAATLPFIQSRNLLVISTAVSKHRRYRLFTARSFDGFFDYIERQQDDGREVMLLSIDDILSSNVGKAFPFGISECEGKAIWKRGR